jgi:transposase
MKNPTSTKNLIDIFVGVDIGKSFHCAAAINGRGTVLLKPLKVIVSTEGFMAFEGRLRQLGDKTTVLIGLEASGHYWMSLWRFLLERDWQVEVFNPVLSSKSARTHLRGRKTDADDALFIARTVRDGDFTPFQPGNEETEQLKVLCRQRRFVSHELSNAKRRLTGLIDRNFPELSRHFEDNHSKAAHAVLKVAPSAAAIARLPLRRLERLLLGASRGRLGAEKAKALRESAQKSLAGGRQDTALDLLVRTMIAQLEFFEGQLAELDAHIEKLFSHMEHPIKTIPGIGSITGPMIAAELGDLRRFEGRRPVHAILAYAGMDPRVRNSGQWSGKIKMSKRGSTALRTALYQAASMARLHEPRLAEIYSRHKQQMNKHHGVAISHVARKLVGIIFAVCARGQSYDPAKICAQPA